jgi:sugar transferase (PEP-CTERM/EpsH1 system associated)
MKLLFLSRWFPYPADNGSKIRIYNLIKCLAAAHEVHLISFATAETGDKEVAVMRRYCRQVDVVRYQAYQPWRWKAIAGLFSPKPRSVVDTYNPDMERLIQQRAGAQSFEMVIASQVDMAAYAAGVTGVPRIFEEIELTTRYEQFSRQRQPLKKAWSRLSWWKLSHYIAQLMAQFDGCTVVSEEEREQLRRVVPHYQAVEVIPNGVDTSAYSGSFGSPAANTLIYSGALTYQANFDAMHYFLGEIFPLIQAQCPSVKLFITGKLDGVPVERLPQAEGVVFTGYLEDIRPTLAQSSVSIVPLRLGGGTRLKVLEALAMGTPVVATTKGAEGLGIVPGQDLLIADEPADFATAVFRLLQNPTLRESLSRRGQQTVKDKYDWLMIGEQFNRFVERIAAQRTLEVKVHD